MKSKQTKILSKKNQFISILLALQKILKIIKNAFKSQKLKKNTSKIKKGKVRNKVSYRIRSKCNIWTKILFKND